ncbi:hypothetical protein MKX01_021109 [Papaver californicum]|nr:hypothetical protein MKX01_021109 [Papaver californicum]
MLSSIIRERNEAPIINLHRSPRLIEQGQDQRQESSNPQNQMLCHNPFSATTKSNLTANLMLCRVRQFREQYQSQDSSHVQSETTMKCSLTNQMQCQNPIVAKLMSTLTSAFCRQVQRRDEQVTIADISLPHQSPRVVEQVQYREEHATEASRMKKSKSVAHDNQKRRRANSYIPGRNTSGSIVIGSTVGAGTSTWCNVTKQVILRRILRLLK